MNGTIERTRLFIHDLPPDMARQMWASDLAKVQVVEAEGNYAHCIGCFGCWIKTPGTCVLKDPIQEVPHKMATSEEIILVSKNVYGDLSPQIKRVMDRCIPYILPYFRVVNGEMHHQLRYNNTPFLSFYFYGEDISQEEKETAKAILQANALNIGATVKNLAFFDDAKDMGGILK